MVSDASFKRITSPVRAYGAGSPSPCALLQVRTQGTNRKLLFVAGQFCGDRLKVLLDFLEVLLYLSLVLSQEVQAFGHGLLTQTDEFGIAVNLTNRHPRGSQTLEELDPGHILLTIGTVAILFTPLD